MGTDGIAIETEGIAMGAEGVVIRKEGIAMRAKRIALIAEEIAMGTEEVALEAHGIAMGAEDPFYSHLKATSSDPMAIPSAIKAITFAPMIPLTLRSDPFLFTF